MACNTGVLRCQFLAKVKLLITIRLTVTFLSLSLSGVYAQAIAPVICRNVFYDSFPQYDYLFFKPDPKRAPGYNAFTRALDEWDFSSSALKKFLDQGDEADVLKISMDSRFRPILFRIQALSRLYIVRDKELFGELTDSTKQLQNAIGELNLAHELTLASIDQKQPQLTAKLLLTEENAKKKLTGVLKESPWLSKKYKNKIRSKLAKVSWRSSKKDRQYILEELQKFVKHLNSQIKEFDFDSDDLEKGLHKLRRQLRWIETFAGALGGVVRTDSKSENILPGYQDLVGLPIKYIPPANRWVEDPIGIPKVTVSAINKIVDEIGAVKDEAEIQMYLQKAGGQFKQPTADVKKFAHDMQNRINRDGILDALEKTLLRESED